MFHGQVGEEGETEARTRHGKRGAEASERGGKRWCRLTAPTTEETVQRVRRCYIRRLRMEWMLEFVSLFVCGSEAGLFPYTSSLNNSP